MVRIYGGILGLLALLTTLARGWLHGGDVEAMLRSAWVNLLLFSLIGLIIGRVAGSIVEDAVVGRLSAEMAAEEVKSGD